jgi:branched-chain amino acid transport system ATP-binding protein
MSEADSPLMAVRAVTHSFRGLKVLRDVNFDILPNRITCLVGPNGAGKSTLFNIISGFLQPLGGRVLYQERDITSWSITQRSRAGLIRTFQTPQIFRHMTVEENLMAGGYMSSRSSFIGDLFRTPASRRAVRQMKEKADEVCERFELRTIAQQRAGDLPAGQQRLVELARAAVTEPRLLCLDEPSSGLNADEVDALRTALRRLQERGTTILLVSHDMDLVKIGATVQVLCFGEIISAGSFDTIVADPRVRDAYLGV